MIVLDGVEWVTAEEAIAQLGNDVTPAMLREWKSRGLIAGHLIGRTNVYPLEQALDAERTTRMGRTRPRRSGLTNPLIAALQCEIYV